MFADVGLAHLQPLNKFPDIQFAIGNKGLDDTKTVGIGEDTEAFGYVDEKVRWEGHVHDFIAIE